MDFRRQALFILVALTGVLGCRHDQAVKRELLERDLRMQEDRIYELEAELEDTQRALDRARGIVREGDSPSSRPGLGSLFGGNSGGSTFAPPSSSPGTTSGPSSINPGSSSGSGSPSGLLPPKNDTNPPAVELPEGSSAPPFRGAPIMSPPDPKKPEGVPAPGGSAPPFKPGGARSGGTDADGFARGTPRLKEMSSPKFVSPGALGNSTTDQTEAVDVIPVPLPADQTVKTISLNRRTAGWNSDGKPGDDGIVVVVEPRNARGEVVAVPGSVVIALWDPAIEGEAGLYSKWDFAVTDAGSLFRSLAAGGSGGMHFELKWPEGPPAHSKLALFVRYVAADGRKLQAEKELHIDLGSGTASAWRNPTTPQPAFTASRSFGPTVAGATREAGATNTAVQAGGEANVNAATPLHWGRPKPSSATPQTPEAFSAPTNAQPLNDPAAGSQTGPSLGPALIAPRN